MATERSTVSEESATVLINVFTEKFFSQLVDAIISANEAGEDSVKIAVLTIVRNVIARITLRDLDTAIQAYNELQELAKVSSGSSKEE